MTNPIRILKRRTEGCSAMESWLIVALVAIIVVGPKNLPKTMRSIARMLGKVQRASSEFKRQIMSLDQEVDRTADDVVSESSRIEHENPSS